MDDNPLPNYDFVGACYDILEIDPLVFSKNEKDEKAFDLGDLVGQVSIDKYKYNYPGQVIYRSEGGGGMDKTVSELFSSYDFQTYLKNHVLLKCPTRQGRFILRQQVWHLMN